MARTSSAHPHPSTRAGRGDHRKVTGGAGQQPSPAWMLTLLNSTMLR
jgi:hypothetical protein